MQVKEVDIDTEKIKGYGICNKKKQNLIFRWSYHSDLLYNVRQQFRTRFGLQPFAENFHMINDLPIQTGCVNVRKPKKRKAISLQASVRSLETLQRNSVT